MDRRLIATALVAAVLFGGGGFAGGTVYGRSAGAKSGANGPDGFVRRGEMPAGARAMGGGLGPGPAGMQRGEFDPRGFVAGEVMAKDEDGITVKGRDGGSKTVFLSGSTLYSRTASGTADDIEVGTQVSVQGVSQDGGIDARRVNIMPGSD